ncbi:conserved hypothetical protein [Paraburkholderia sacchari]|uniref:hypothetical protein n=1 Tax=Paraburkholderia sacchari TaxID=159450 RepID=UPI0039A6D7AE
MFGKDKISIRKQNGENFDDRFATVSSDLIVYKGSAPLIESGDLIERKMSNGGTEIFRVIDPGFYEGHSAIGPHYQMKVQKLGLVEAKQAVESITHNYHITGDNARINNNSIDNSTNFVNRSPELVSQLGKLKAELLAAVTDVDARNIALETVDEIEDMASRSKPKTSVITALLNSLPQVANVATIVASIVALLPK